MKKFSMKYKVAAAAAMMLVFGAMSIVEGAEIRPTNRMIQMNIIKQLRLNAIVYMEMEEESVRLIELVTKCNKPINLGKEVATLSGEKLRIELLSNLKGGSK